MADAVAAAVAGGLVRARQMGHQPRGVPARPHGCGVGLLVAHTVVIMRKIAQIGKTELLNNMVGFHVHHDPAPILVLQPTLEMGDAWSKDRLAPMLRDTPALRGKVADPKARASGNTKRHKSFVGGHITIAGANSPASLASRPIRIVMADEVDRYPPSAGTEGDPVSLARERTTTFWNRKLVLTSTPTVKGKSRIEKAFAELDRRRYWVPCPGCGEKQTLRWSQVRWEQEEGAESAYYLCDQPDRGPGRCRALGGDPPRRVARRGSVQGHRRLPSLALLALGAARRDGDRLPRGAGRSGTTEDLDQHRARLAGKWQKPGPGSVSFNRPWTEFLGGVDADDEDGEALLQRLRGKLRPDRPGARHALDRPHPPAEFPLTKSVDRVGVIAARVDRGRCHREAAAVGGLGWGQQILVELAPRLRRREVAVDNLVLERPAFVAEAPADALCLEAIALDVDADGDDEHLRRRGTVPAGRLGPGEKRMLVDRLALLLPELRRARCWSRSSVVPDRPAPRGRRSPSRRAAPRASRAPRDGSRRCP